MRTCPSCGEKTIKTWKLMFPNVQCIQCRKFIGAHWLYGLLFFFVGFFVCLIGTLYLFNLFGLNSTIPIILLWCAFEFFRELLVPLEVKDSKFLD